MIWRSRVDTFHGRQTFENITLGKKLLNYFVNDISRFIY